MQDPIDKKFTHIKHLVVLIKKQHEDANALVNLPIQADCTNTHLIAHTPDEKEIAATFKQLPWCQYISFRDEAIISRKAWELSTREVKCPKQS